MKQLVKIGGHLILRGATREEYEKMLKHSKATTDDIEAIFDYPLEEMEDDTVEDNGYVYVELTDVIDGVEEKRYYESFTSRYNLKPYDIFGELNSENFKGCTSICKYHVEELNDDVLSLVFENVHHLIGNLQATHEYGALISATTLKVYGIDEVAHGSWWNWDLKNLDDDQIKIRDSIVNFAKQWLAKEKELKEANK